MLDGFVLKRGIIRSCSPRNIVGMPNLRAFSHFGLFAAFLFLFFLLIPCSLADRMIIPVQPDVSVYEPAQKAIIAWNGREEILVLSTDVNGEVGTFALEVMPLPSNPKAIEKASFESFETVQSLIWANVPTNMYKTLGGREEAVDTVRITFHEKIGAHDITVVNASDASQLSRWAGSFLERNGVAESLSMKEFEPVWEDYLNDGFSYFVFDLIELSEQKNSLEPILYKFETSFLYYPLRISSLNPGNTKIILFLLTKDIVDQLFCYPFRIAQYQSRFQPQTSSRVQFSLTHDEVNRISIEIGKLFEGNPWLTALEYEGTMDILTRDLKIHSSALPLSRFVRVIPVILSLGLIGSGTAIVVYASVSILMKRKYTTPPQTHR